MEGQTVTVGSQDTIDVVMTSSTELQEVIVTGYGTSRFAKEANNLFGIRTWDKNAPQLKAKENPNASWGVKKYPTKCLSVKNMINIINNKEININTGI